MSTKYAGLALGALGPEANKIVAGSSENAVREVEQALSDLSMAINSLDVLIASLSSRIEPALRPEVTSAVVGETAPYRRETTLGQAIERATNRVESSNAWLRSVIDRLEL